MSATPDSTLANPEQRIADLERQLAEALAQQTATAEVLQVINSSPGDLVPVFEAILEKAHSLCEASFGGLWTYDGEHFDFKLGRGISEPLRTFVDRNSPGPGTGFARIAAGENLVHIVDAPTHGLSHSEFAQAFIQLGGARTVIVVALRKDDKLLGAITAFRREVHPFTDKQIALLQNFAAQAVIAMENARLLTETREALEQQTATAEVLQVINCSPGDLAPVFDAMLEKAVRLCDAGFGVLYTFDGEVADTVAVHNLPKAYTEYHWRELRRFNPAGLFGRAIQQRRTIHVADLSAEEPHRDGVPVVVASVELGGVRTLVHVPLLKEDRVIGVFSIYRQEARNTACPSEELDPAGTSNSMNVRLTEAEIHAVSIACRTAVSSHR